ncbi:MAG: hypothetical protein LBD50_00700 [Rickettsiales bacterium]|nr:hypothetical protein [Rickettsiales bacterium]
MYHFEDDNEKLANQIRNTVQRVSIKREAGYSAAQIKEADTRAKIQARTDKRTQVANASDLLYQPEAGLVARLTGSELGEHSDIKQLRSSASDWYKNNLLGKIITRPEIGDIHFYNRGLKEFRSYGANPIKLKSVVAIPDLIKNGQYTGFVKSYKNRKYGIVGFHHFIGNINLNGEFISEEVLVAQDNQGNLFYQLKMPEGDTEFQIRAPSGFLNQTIPNFDDEVNIKIVKQNNPQGTATDRFRAAYSPALQKIIFKPNADITSIVHEFSHLFMDNYFKWMRSGQASESFRQRWGAVEEWAGMLGHAEFGTWGIVALIAAAALFAVLLMIIPLLKFLRENFDISFDKENGLKVSEQHQDDTMN